MSFSHETEHQCRFLIETTKTAEHDNSKLRHFIVRLGEQIDVFCLNNKNAPSHHHFHVPQEQFSFSSCYSRNGFTMAFRKPNKQLDNSSQLTITGWFAFPRPNNQSVKSKLESCFCFSECSIQNGTFPKFNFPNGA